ncbi:MAG: alpha/beta hydrolase [Candidatus Thermoplasmatota archaeon]|jgi:pimeloyl-ACP methyl ester carboxylesterase|nr:alpha/beta hydrolase [Candidatus Thermoplasmatota archaeon]
MERLVAQTSLGKISYLHRNGRLPLIFLHGLGGTGNSWIKLNHYLDSRFELFMVDLLGHGRSDKPGIEYSIHNQCEFITEFVDVLDIKPFGLLGNSYGGWIAAKLAAGYVQSDYLYLVDSAGVNPTVGESNTSDAFLDMLMKISRYNRRDIMKKIIMSNSRTSEKLDPEELHNLKAGTIIIWGEDDNVIPLKYGIKFHEMIPGSLFFKIDGAGHIPQVTHPEKVSEIINGTAIE